MTPINSIEKHSLKKKKPKPVCFTEFLLFCVKTGFFSKAQRDGFCSFHEFQVTRMSTATYCPHEVSNILQAHRFEVLKTYLITVF